MHTWLVVLVHRSNAEYHTNYEGNLNIRYRYTYYNPVWTIALYGGPADSVATVTVDVAGSEQSRINVRCMQRMGLLIVARRCLLLVSAWIVSSCSYNAVAGLHSTTSLSQLLHRNRSIMSHTAGSMTAPSGSTCGWMAGKVVTVPRGHCGTSRALSQCNTCMCSVGVQILCSALVWPNGRVVVK